MNTDVAISNDTVCLSTVLLWAVAKALGIENDPKECINVLTKNWLPSVSLNQRY